MLPHPPAEFPPPPPYTDYSLIRPLQSPYRNCSILEASPSSDRANCTCRAIVVRLPPTFECLNCAESFEPRPHDHPRHEGWDSSPARRTASPRRRAAVRISMTSSPQNHSGPMVGQELPSSPRRCTNWSSAVPRRSRNEVCRQLHLASRPTELRLQPPFVLGHLGPRLHLASVPATAAQYPKRVRRH